MKNKAILLIIALISVLAVSLGDSAKGCDLPEVNTGGYKLTCSLDAPVSRVYNDCEAPAITVSSVVSETTSHPDTNLFAKLLKSKSDTQFAGVTLSVSRSLLYINSLPKHKILSKLQRLNI